MRLRLYVLTLPGDSKVWAVMGVRSYPLAGEYGLLVRNGDEERTVVVDVDTYNAIFDAEANPPRWFRMEDSDAEFDE